MSVRDSDSFGSRRRLAAAAASNDSVTSSNRNGTQMYQPGTPIGYLAARGTPFEKKYFTKKLGFCCLFIAPIVLLVVGVITLVPVLGAIAEHALHTAQFHIYSSNITDAGNSSFPLTLSAQVKKTGIFPAHLYFRKPIDVYWMSAPPDMREIHLGHFDLAFVGAAAGHAKVNQLTTFYIDDEDGFGLFAQYLVSQPVFTWRINCTEVHAEAFSFFPVYKYLPLQKDLVINGIDNLHDLKLVDVQLPGDDPAGGIQVSATATLINPSPFGIEIGTLGLDLYYNDLYLGPVSADGVNLTAGLNILTLNGRLIPYANNQSALNQLGELFTNYINSVPSIVIARGRTAVKPDGQVVTWLATGITALASEIPFLPPTPINPIKGITIDYISLVYSQELPYNPDLFSNALTGQFALPFGFSLNITQLATELNIYTDGAIVGTATGPFSQANTDIQVLSTGETAGDINLTLPPTQLILPNTTDAAKKELITFQNAFVYMADTAFQAQGAAKAITSTPVGEILLNGINFDVTTGLIGLNGLTTYPTIINSVDVTGGVPDGVTLAVGLTLVNPSNLNLSVGDTTFQLSNQVVLGNTTLADLLLTPGRNDKMATAYFDPNRAPIGLETLNRFISGLDTQLNITGFAGSSPIVSLAASLVDIKLNSTLPGLTTTLVKSANLTVLPTTGITDDVANSIVYLANPFTSDLVITSITANASSHGVFLATIDTALNFPALGKATTASPNVPLTINLFPPDLFGLLRALVIDANLNPAYLDGLVSIAGYTLTPTTNANSPGVASPSRKRDVSFIDEEDNVMAQRLMGVGANAGVLADLYDSEEEREGDEDVQSDGFAKRAEGLVYANVNKRDNLYTGFDLGTYVLQAFASATADLVITSDAIIGSYGTTLTFSQNNVPLGTDDTLLMLLPPVALPIVQKIVDGSILNIDRVTITDPRATSFTASLQGSLTNAGPFDGIVNFPNGLDIYYQGQLLTQTAFPNITLVGDLGSSINVELEGQIPDVDFFTTFLEDALTNPSFVWNIRGTGLSVSAIGIVVPGVSINKDVQLAGLNNLAGQVIINSFDVPENDPAGGLHLTADSTINNPAQVGITLSAFGVNIYDGANQIGPTAAVNAFTLQALAVTAVPLAGRLIEQTTTAGLAALSDIFTRFVHNQNTDLVIQGDYAGPADVLWLNNGIKVLKVTVSLPSQEFQVIRLISLNQLSLFFTVPTAYAPQSDSSNTTANFFLPFGFPLDISSINGPFTINYNDADVGVLNIPASPATTDVEARILTLMFTNVPLAVLNNAHQLFSTFVADFTKGTQVTLNLHGTASAVANTAAGTLNIADIPFNLDTNLLGLQNLDAQPALVSNLDVVHGYPTYLMITVDTALYNPSDTTVGAGDVAFAVLFQNDVIGTALINDIVLVPGTNEIPTQINYMPIGTTNVASGQLLLENYVQNVTSAALVQGNSQTTPIESLQEGLGGIALNTNIPPLEKLIVTQASLVVPKDIAQTGIAMTSVTVANPFTASINIIDLNADANFGAITIGTINQNLAATNNIVRAPGKVTTVSQQIPININIDPKNLIRFIEAAAAAYGVSLGPLPPFFQEVLDLPSTVTTISPYPDDTAPPCNSGRAFDTLGAILALLKPLAASIPIQSTLLLDDYQTNLDFMQSPVPVATDNTALYLVGPAAAPLIQLVVNQSVLTVSQANATSLTDSGFMVSLIGQLMTDAPADAYIEFPDGITINFLGVDMATLTLTPICSSPPDGVPILQATGQLTIIDEAQFEQFAYYILTEPNFQWFLHTNTASVRALGIKFSNVYLAKTIQLDSFNGIPGLVITQFEAPSDAVGRINIFAQTPITSLASLGVELDYASFELFFQGSDIGQITSELLFLALKQTTLATFNGFLSDQTGNTQGLDNLGILFSQFLAGTNSTLTIRGLSVVTRANNNQPVKWLTAAFLRFSDTVILPGHIYQIIFAITLSDLTVTVINPTPDSYTLPTSNNKTVAEFSNPFGFHLQPLSIIPLITLTFNGANAAQLNLPSTNVVAGTSTGPTDMQPIQFGFKNDNLVAIDHAAFQALFATLADTAGATFGLMGSTSVVAKTNIGNIPITGIPFSVTTSLAGINDFNGVAPLSDVQVDHATPQYIGINLLVSLANPSQITLFTDQISLPAYFTDVTPNVYIGRATIPTLNLYPGTNTVMTLFEFMITDNSSQIQQVLQNYLQPLNSLTGPGVTSNLRIQGLANADPVLTPYDSLVPALVGVDVTSSLASLGTRVVQAIRVYIPVSAVIDGVVDMLNPILGLLPVPITLPVSPPYVYAYVDSVNDLPIELRFDRLDTTVYDTDDTGAGQYAQFSLNFTASGTGSYILPAATTTNEPANGGAVVTSPVIPNILLSQGLAASLNLIGHNTNIDNYIRIYLDDPVGGDYYIPGLHYIEDNVPTTYYLSAVSNGPDSGGLDISGLGTLTGIITAILGDAGLASVFSEGLAALDTANPLAVIQAIGAIPDVGPTLQGALCTTSGFLGLGAIACETTAQAAASSSAASASTASVAAAAASSLSSVSAAAASVAAAAASSLGVASAASAASVLSVASVASVLSASSVAAAAAAAATAVVATPAVTATATTTAPILPSVTLL
ncbi:hypothetical protein CBS101457_005289 [Exobasidium rhododendri]|nr:hypothetical protein CBS101457_005289 [Exobasidium rhododendri]